MVDSINMLEILIITVAIVYVWEYSGFIFDLTKGVFKMLNPSKEYMGQSLPKPFGCSACMVLWVVLIYGLLYLKLSMVFIIGISVGCSFFSTLISKVLGKIVELINNI